MSDNSPDLPFEDETTMMARLYGPEKWAQMMKEAAPTMRAPGNSHDWRFGAGSEGTPAATLSTGQWLEPVESSAIFQCHKCGMMVMVHPGETVEQAAEKKHLGGCSL